MRQSYLRMCATCSILPVHNRSKRNSSRSNVRTEFDSRHEGSFRLLRYSGGRGSDCLRSEGDCDSCKFAAGEFAFGIAQSRHRESYERSLAANVGPVHRPEGCGGAHGSRATSPTHPLAGGGCGRTRALNILFSRIEQSYAFAALRAGEIKQSGRAVCGNRLAAFA